LTDGPLTSLMNSTREFPSVMNFAPCELADSAVVPCRVGIIADKFVEDIIMEPIAIARHYLRTWFLIDFISSIPLDYIILAMSPDTNVTQMMHAGRGLFAAVDRPPSPDRHRPTHVRVKNKRTCVRYACVISPYFTCTSDRRRLVGV